MASEQKLNSVFEDTANAIRSKTGKTAKIKPINFADEINTITVDNTALNGLLDGTITEISNDTVTKLSSFRFYQMYSLTTANFPNVTFVGYYCFGSCTALTSIDLPKVTYFSTTVFRGCSNLNTVIIRTPTVCTLSDTDIFSNTPIATSETEGYIYVPDELVDSYKAATNWSTYASKIKPITELGE